MTTPFLTLRFIHMDIEMLWVLAWDFNNNTMYASEAGRIGNDEINVIKAGENYGWPIEECGNLEESLFINAEFCFTPSIYPSGILISNSTELDYYGKLIVATLKGEHLRSIDLNQKINLQY